MSVIYRCVCGHCCSQVSGLCSHAFSLLKTRYLCLSLLFPRWVQAGPSARSTLCRWEWKCGKSLAPMDEFCFQAPDSFAERQSNSQRHLLPPHPDAQLMWAWHALIYGGWAWLTMFFQSYTGSSMKNSQQQQPKLDSKISSMWTLAGERFYHCRLCYPKRLSIYNRRRSPSAKETWVLWGPAGTAVATYTLL